MDKLTGFVPSFWTMDGLYWQMHTRIRRENKLDNDYRDPTFVRKSDKATLDPSDQ